MANFYKRLSYSFGNEDWETEQDALKIKPKDRVVCVTASGDRPLHLMMMPCDKIISIDANGVQSHLLHLKKAAMQNLDYEHYVAFLGVRPSDDRLEVFKTKILPIIDKEAGKFWLSKPKMVEKGVLYQGIAEKVLAKSSMMLQLIRGKKVARLFEFDDIEEQKEFVKYEWNKLWWRKAFDIFTHPKISRLYLNDPCFYTNIDPSFHSGKYMYEKFNQGLSRHLAKDNYLLSLFFKGRVEEAALPPYLQKKSFERIKKRLDRISVKTGNIVHYLEKAPPNTIDCFSLSDIASYMNQSDFDRMMKAVHRSARNGARFCIRELLSRQKIPEHLESHFVRDNGLEKELEENDRCFFYRFMTGTISK